MDWLKTVSAVHGDDDLSRLLITFWSVQKLLESARQLCNIAGGIPERDVGQKPKTNIMYEMCALNLAQTLDCIRLPRLRRT